MSDTKVFAPEHLEDAARGSGFFHCKKCGLVWFGAPENNHVCPEGPHGRPVAVVLLCRKCDLDVPLAQLSEHLAKHR